MKMRLSLFIRWGTPAALAASLLAAAALNSAPGTSRTEFFSVPAGASAGATATRLQREGHIRSARWFLFCSRLTRASHKLRAGLYQIRRGQGAWGILSDLSQGRVRGVRVTLPEGFASWQIAERLAEAGVCSAEDFKRVVSSQSLEGVLFPDTYYFEQNTPAARTAGFLRERFEDVWDGVLARAMASGAVTETRGDGPARKYRLAHGRLWTQNELVTLASLIEREARRTDERPRVSSVYHNRLKKRMPLESDPTVQFALGYWKERIFYRDLDVQSPYNTYRRQGLPPGPICSPGRASLEAAFSPAPGNDLYFVADEEGGHLFSASYDEHLRWVRERNQKRRLNKKRAAGKG